MKVAILISGQARNFEEGYKHLKKAYLDRYDCDVYCHVWDAKEVEQTQFFPNKPPKKYTFGDGWKDKLEELYSPTEISYEEPQILDTQGIKDPVWRQPLQNTKSMFYSMKQVWDITPPGFDVYIRTRFDLMYEDSTLNLEDLDLSKLHVWDWNTNEPYKSRGYYDVFAIGNYDTIGIYSNVYPRIDWYLQHDEVYRQFLQGDSPLRNEYLLKWHLLSSGVNVIEHPTTIPNADGQIIR